MIPFAAVLLVLVVPFMPFSSEDEVGKVLKSLEGKWKAVALEAGGKPLPKEAVPEFYFIVGAGGKATGKMGNSEYTATMTIDPSRNPKTMDNKHESGPDKGKTQYAVYKLEGDKWTVCITAPGAAESSRPKDFNTQNSTNVVFVFEKVEVSK